MCVYSMISDHYYDKWKKIQDQQVQPWTAPVPSPISPAEIEEFRKLLERAREYDKRMNQPDCELEEKRNKLKELAKELGVEISFL